MIEDLLYVGSLVSYVCRTCGLMKSRQFGLSFIDRDACDQ